MRVAVLNGPGFVELVERADPQTGPGVRCRGWEQCLAGRHNLCPDMLFHATPPVDGSLAELVAVHHAFAHPVPDSVSDEEAALLEPLSMAVWACRKGQVGAASRVLVTGAGPIGGVCRSAGPRGAARVLGASGFDDRSADRCARAPRRHQVRHQPAGVSRW